ncbi:MAG: Mg2+ and Co2+ transporter CorB [Christensenellaceae bacterium]|nr:Mg2+ and Co2+ transporter CorB [Christensenellaceae bacterium]
MKHRLPLKKDEIVNDSQDTKDTTNTTARKRDGDKRSSKKTTIWIIKIVIVTFILSCAFSYISELTATYAHLLVSFALILVLISVNILFDAIAVATTSCELAPLLSMASRKVKGGKVAVKLVKNSERVSSICADVIGDICGIISGACSAAILLKTTNPADQNDKMMFWLSILCSGIVAAFTVGGKAIFKEIAVKKSKEVVMLVAKLITPFFKSK